MQKLYHELAPDNIVKDIQGSAGASKITILGTEYLICPSVYPSDRFRTTNFLLTNLKPLLQDAKVCDMGCGMGIVGLFALKHGAQSVTQADINPMAVKNAKANKAFHHFSDVQLSIYESCCFDQVPPQIFDLIVFNIPFHSESYDISDPLEYAFHDPDFQSTKRFLFQAQEFSHPMTKIIIAFSNKGDTQALEDAFDMMKFKWHLWKTANTDQAFDNRLYMLENSSMVK